MTTATLRLACPPMKISRVGRRLRRTASEPMQATMILEDGTVLDLGTATIPETDVHKIGLGHWRVDGCDGETPPNAMPSVFSELPPEDTYFDIDENGPCFYAQPIDAPTEVMLERGSVWTGYVTYPLCRIDLFTMTAEAVVAEGALTKNQ